ncbi:hypothetical protein U3A55_11940 [Salarchaeum sp. III]|uniref:hypothetical protein n=1 Tax=Salarchaeum sp. III TaxID=3107927 RepID=UPI002EDAFB62
MWVTPTLTIPDAHPYGDDRDPVTGVFEFSKDIQVEIETRTEKFFESGGETAVIVDWLASQTGIDLPGTGFRQSLNFDFGAGVHAITLDYRAMSDAGDRWGDSGEGGTRGDASGEDLHARMAVLDRYLQTATLDSQNPATLSVSEYSSEGRYGPLDVVPESPNMVFDGENESSVFDGSITFIETLSLEQVIDGQNQRG